MRQSFAFPVVSR